MDFSAVIWNCLPRDPQSQTVMMNQRFQAASLVLTFPNRMSTVSLSFRSTFLANSPLKQARA